MTYSMTGFGRHESENIHYKIVIEIKSVNHRYNDIIIKMPRKLNSLEEKMKNVIKEHINRGRVEVFVNFEESEAENLLIVPNYTVLDQYVSALDAIKERYQVSDDVGVSLLARYPDVLKIDFREADEEEIWTLMEDALNGALKALVEMRKVEGAKLKHDTIERVDVIRSIVKNIEKLAPTIIATHKDKMLERIQELLNDTGVELDEQRIATEIAVFSDKTNITEEIVRLESHFEQLVSIFNESKPVGRKLDFLIQEINREVNTIGSKSPDIDISNYVVDMKSEIEKIREQIQNIE
ncbi:MAG: YicC family protein [Clostridia bacterium]|nr:YicC family protein [Clostridia bacterium]